jgi:outer membrane receptor for ferrienterochelin and colicins
MQGLNSKYILFLIDGERVAGEVRDNMDYSRLNISNVEKIEVVNGASSSLYGSNAIGGVINIITKKTSEPFEANIHARLTKNNDLVTGTNFGFKFNKVTTYTDFIFKRTDGYDLTPASADLWTIEPFRDFTVNQKISYKASNKLNFSALGTYYSHERFDVSTIPKHPNYDDLTGSFKADYQPNEKARFEASYHTDKYQIYDILERLNNEKERTYSDLVNNARISGLFNFNTNQVIDNHQLTTGLEYLGEELFSDRIENMKKSNYNMVFFAQHDLKIKPGINTITGMRIDKNSEFGTWFSPKISVMYNYRSINLRASCGLGFRAPSLKERYFRYRVPVGFDLIGNPKLKAENSRYISGSIEFIKENYNGSVSVYNNYLNGMIHDTWDTGVPNLVTYKNINQARVNGIDFIYRAKLIFGFSMGGGYSFVNAKDLTAKTVLEGTNKHTANVSLEYTFRKLNYFLNVNLQGRYLSEKNYQTFLNNEFLIRNFPAHSVWKITTMQKFYNYFNLTLGIDNLFNYKNTFEPDIVFIDPGIRLFVGMNIRLDKGIINLFKKHN